MVRFGCGAVHRDHREAWQRAQILPWPGSMGGASDALDGDPRQARRGAGHSIAMTCAQIASIPRNKPMDANAAASSTTERNIALSPDKTNEERT